MKTYFLILLISFFSICSFCQELIIKSKFEKIQYVESVDWYNQDIYCAGYSFETQYNDGNSTDAYLINYDLNLKPKWTLNISDSKSNIIYTVKRYNEKIYALVTQGEIQPLTQNVSISLFIISLDGKIEDKVLFGPTFHSPTNLIINGDDLIFGNKVSNGINYSSSSVSEIITYNLKTKKTTRVKSNKYLSRPKKIIIDHATIFLFGIYIHQNQPNIMVSRKGKYFEISLKASKEEYFMDSYLNDKTLTVIATFPGGSNSKNKYLKLYYINTDNFIIQSKVITYEELGLSNQKFDAFPTEDGKGSWLIMEESQSKKLKYILLDNNGKIIKTYNFDSLNGNGNWERSVFKEDKILNANSKGIYLYKA